MRQDGEKGYTIIAPYVSMKPYKRFKIVDL